ncbi:MAG TPA: glucokinase [Thermoanaerobaculia bacterium]|nr:glucokinase [Thermoanaerobaculia bacterium]
MSVIAGDIGGTKTLLRCVESSGAISAETRFDSARYRTFDDLLREFIPFCSAPIEAACFAVAGPVLASRAEVTNLKWLIDSAELQRGFGIPHVELINDFFAVALGVPLLGPADLVSLQQGTRDRGAPIAILGAGTGLGEAMVTRHRDEWVVIPSEGGHADFAPQDEEQMRLLAALQKKYGHVSWERVISGMGLTNIYEFLAGRREDPAGIAELARSGDDTAVRTFEIFVDIYGAEAGNAALRVLARGGVFLAGGVAAKNQPFFTDGRFMAAFLRKGRFVELLREMPVDLIVNEHVGLIGAAARAKAEGRGHKAEG